MEQKMVMDSEKYRHLAFALSIVVLLDRFLYVFAECFHFSDIARVLFLGTVGLVALILGLFTFHKSLKFGLAIGGIIAGRMAWWYYRLKLSETLKFLVTVLLLLVVCFALYRLYTSSQQVTKRK